ncbi:restriction endonuclease subunit S [Legionella genomosp. 1]|uniref:restriction endonuclease subunit S n=1 Tax=Legionella genomosp. 1 TaxID=1093625 RepID=UPI001056E0C8|nr:restriction endonuclease subunit S [Legionella genomosp. 1]
MNHRWLITKLSTLGTFDRGKSKHRPRDASHLYGGQYPFIQTGDITASGGRITCYKQTYSEAGLAQSKLWPAGTLCITIAANIADTALLTFPACFPDSVVGFIPYADKADVRFIEFMFRAFRANVKSKAYGSVQENINLEVLRNLAFPIPDFATQKIIADFLTAFDDRIALLRETNVTLESIAQALFKSWFIDFDPVHAKAEGREPEGMDAETAALFPDGFEESSLGLIPKGWHVTNLDNAYQINPIRKLKKGELAPYLDMANVPIRGHHADKITMREMGSGTKFINGDTLLARITPCLENGKTAFVDFLDDNQVGWGSTEFVVLRPKEPIPLYHGYLLARHSAFREFAIQSMSGTSGRQRIQNNVLGRYSIVVPDYRVLKLFGSIVSSIQQKISSNSRQAKFLASQRNILLPQLISGQVSLAKEEMKVYEA